MSAALAALAANLTYLDLGNNALSGALGSAACGPPSAGLQALYLGSNLLGGSLPACLFTSGAAQRLLCEAAAQHKRTVCMLVRHDGDIWPHICTSSNGSLPIFSTLGGLSSGQSTEAPLQT